MTGQNLTKPVHNQKLNLFLKLENPGRPTLDTAWSQPARQKLIFWVRFSKVVVVELRILLLRSANVNNFLVQDIGYLALVQL